MLLLHDFMAKQTWLVLWLSKPAFFRSLSHVQLLVTPWTAACQVSLSFTNSQTLLNLMSIEKVMSSNHLILCGPLLFLPSIFSTSGSFLRSQFFASVLSMNMQD